MRMLTTDITEINAMPVACIFANAFYIGVVRTGLILIAEISVGFICVFLRQLERRNLSP